MGAFDDLIPGGQGGGGFDDLIPKKKKEPEKSGTLETVKNVAGDVSNALGEGAMGIQAGVGTFVQAPAANTLSAVMGAKALAERGISWLERKAGGPGEVNQDVMRDAQDASAFAAEQRQANVDAGNDNASAWANPRTAIARVGLGMTEDARARTGEIQADNRANAPELIRQQEAMGNADGFLGTLKAIKENPRAFTYTLARSVPDMGLGLVFARLAAAGKLEGAVAAGDAAAARVAAAGGDSAAQMAAAREAIDQVQQQAIGRASAAGTFSEAGSSAYNAREGTYQQVMNLPQQTLDKSDRYRELLAQTGDAQQARERLANELADQTPMLTAAGTAAGTKLANRVIGEDATAQTIAGVNRITPREFGRRVAGDTLEEGLQGVPEDLVQHGAIVQANPDAKLDLGGSLAQNLAAGGAMGAGGHGAAYARQSAADLMAPRAGQNSPDAEQNPPQAGQNAPKAEQPAQQYPDAVSRETQPAVQEPTEAERALRAPANLTALDQVQEITDQQDRIERRLQELSDPAYGQMFDRERQDLQQRVQQLEQQRQQMTQGWPQVVPGAQTSFTTEAGARLNAQYALVEARDLVTSHDENLRQNPAYPQELQPRARDRAASEMQISGIVQKLDPARLGLSADAATGAPIVGADGLVESGNARTISLKRIYQANGQKAADYRQFLADNAAQFGLTPEQVAGMEKPVLVRVRSTPVNRAEFARQANASTVAAMSPTEQAKADAARIDSMEDLSPDDQGDFQTSREFIRRFMARLPVTEQAGMVDASGRLSSAGYARVRNAVLAKAYGDSPVLMRMVESMDDNLRNVTKALVMAAPRVAQMREAVAAGQRFDADITPDLMAAVEELSRLKDDGTSIEDALAQAGMFGDKYSAETRDLLQFLADNLRRPRRIAEFIQNYMQALDAAGDPNQGSLLGDVQAPAKADLMASARRLIEGEGNAQGSDRPGQAAEGPGTGGQGGGQQQDAQGGARGAQGDGSAAAAGTESAKPEWVAFPSDFGSLGIPRADMPQIKGSDRGALVQFLDARGIGNEKVELPASDLKPTQVEFAPEKVKKWNEKRAGVDRSVLISRDGYVLDGHHQWVAALAANEPVQAIRFDADMQDLLPNVFAFPSVTRGGGATDAKALREAAVQDFKDALADLAQIATKHTRAAMMPEDTPGLMPTLVKLFDAAIRIVGTDLKAATRYVREQLRANPDTKKIANFIKNETMEKAAREAFQKIEQEQAAPTDLLGQVQEAAEAPKVAKINGRAYDLKRDNFKPKLPPEFLTPELLKKADEFIEKYFKAAAPFEMAQADRTAGEELLRPYVRKAEDVKAAYDQKIIDIAQRTGALGQMLAPIKGMKRAVEKMKQDQIEAGAADMDPRNIKDLLRSTIVVSHYDEAQGVVAEIEKEFKVLRIKNRTESSVTGAKTDGRGKTGGYADVLINVEMPNGTTAEIQINVPEMLSIKEHQGHKLYEAARDLPAESKLKDEIYGAMTEIYDAAFETADARKSAAQPRKAASEIGAQPENGNRVRGTSSSPESASMNTRPSGNSTNSSPLNDAKNRQPAGKASGTGIDITSPLDQSVSQLPANGYTERDLFGENDATLQPGGGSDQGKGSGSAQKAAGGGKPARVRPDAGVGDLFAGNDADAAGSGPRQVGQAGADGVRGADARGGSVEPGDRAGRPAGVPAGRDIPAKTGRNYRFGNDDLTYEGSWFKKAEQNVEAVELLRTLEKEGRQATPEEQAKLAKFIGWGSSEMANGIFGTKIERNLAKLGAYVAARKLFDEGAKEISTLNNEYYRIRAYLPYVRYGSPITPADVTLAKWDLDSQDVKYFQLRERLKAAMTESEWAEAKRSTQYAHYTSKAVVQSMWKAMERMGFAGGTILEPGAGIGVFPGLMPEAMANNSAYTGIEFDSITGGILKQLFPDERILVESFVDTKLPKNFYDVAIGNPPFSGTKILGDPEYAKRALSLHDYFFAKSIDRVKPGGLVVYVTSRYTMDKIDDKARAYLADRADLVGAIRLPQTAFKQNAGTEVVTDVIFLRKKVPGEKFEGAQAWAKSGEIKGADGKTLMVKDQHGTEKPAMVNEYFAAHPEMVLGKHANTGSMYSDQEYTVTPLEGDIEQHFAKAIENLPAGIYQPERGSAAEAAKVREIDFNPKAKKEGNYYVSDKGELMIRESGVGQAVDIKSAKDRELIKAFVPLRDALKQAHYDQLNDGPWEESLKALQAEYAKFTKAHGQINQFVTRIVKSKVVDEDTGETYTDETPVRSYPLLEKLRDDPDYTLVAALETINDDTGEIKPSAFLTDRVLGKPGEANVKTPGDALLSSLNDVGHVDIPLIAQRLGLSEAEAIEALGSAIYQDPEAGWQTSDEYLTGNVKRKLEAARVAAQADKRFERNVAALEARQPAPKTPSQINVSLGMNWVPGEVYQDFLRELAGTRATVEWNARTKQWVVQEQSGGRTMQATADWGTADRNITDLLEHALTGRPIRISRTQGAGKDKTTVFDAAATEAANQKLEKLREEFSSWVWKDAARTDRLVKLYNDTFNTTVPREFDGSHLTLPGTSKAFHIFDHVKRGAWRIIQEGNTYLAHAVGSGKTFQMVIANMEMKRLGLVKKPMVVVPNHMLKQFAHEWQQLYPAARLMVADENNFHTDNRRRFVSRVALSDLDGVVITHSAFKLLDLDPEFKRKIIERQLDVMRAALEQAEDEEGKGSKRSPRIKQIEKQIENLEQKLEAALSSDGKDRNVRFDELGVDFLMVDEAHEFRKLDFATSRQVKGISPQGSARALDLYIKSRYLEEKTPGRSLVMASGTPVTNTLAELYTVQRFMDEQTLIEKGLDDFDSWAAMFGRERTVLEPNAAGKYEPVTRFSKFVNVPELTQMFREFADVLTADKLAALLGDKRPKVEGGARKIIVTPKGRDYGLYQKELEARVAKSKAWKPSKDEPNNPDPIIKIIGDGRLAAIDMRFIWPDSPSDPDSKLNKMIDDVIATYKATSDMEFTDKAGKVEPNKGASMMVFSDLGFGAGVAASRGFNARAWFEKRLRDAGVPPAQVAFMSDYKKSADKLKLFKDVNAGRVRVLVGSSKNMGTGVNAQQRLKALFHLDSPWYPADLEQREGRIIRQGNKNKLVQIFAYAAKGTYDENMWKMLASKQYFIDQALSGDENIRELEDLDSQSQYDLAAAMVAEDPRVLQLAGAKAEIEKLNRLYQAHEDQRFRFRRQFEQAQLTVEFNEKRLPEAERLAKQVQDLSGENFKAKALGKTYTDRKEWAGALMEKFKDLMAKAEPKPLTLGEISGFPIVYTPETVGTEFRPKAMMQVAEPLILFNDPSDPLAGIAMRAQNAVAEVARTPAKMRERITEARAQLDALQTRLEAPFPMSGMLADKVKEAADLEAAIKADNQERTFRVERKDTGLGFDVKATSADEAIAKAVESNGGNPADWTAKEEKPAEPEGADAPKLARGTGAGGMAMRDLQAVVDRVSKGLKNLPRVHVFASPADLSAKIPDQKALRDYIKKQGAMADVEGATHNGEIYLFASGLADEAAAEHVLATHEITHYGLRGAMGKDLDAALQHVWVNNTKVRKAAAELRQRLGLESNLDAVEEVLADMPNSDLVQLTGWRRIVKAARDWLNRIGAKSMAARVDGLLQAGMDDQARADLFVADLVRAARDWVRTGRGGRGGVMSDFTRLSSLAEDAAKQEQWLTAEAKARGYRDIEDMLEKNYPLFEKLAAKWREKNPAEGGVMLSRAPAVDSAAFRKWFGDSKVVDAEGKPLVVYHGTGAAFTVFKDNQDGGHYFSADMETAEWFSENADKGWVDDWAPRVEKVYLSIKKPMVLDYDGLHNAIGIGEKNELDADSIDWTSMPSLIDEAKREGYDGLHLIGVPEYNGKIADQWIAFRSEQIKSAIGNNGNFDRTNPDIRMSRAPQRATAAERADKIIAEKAGGRAPVDALARTLTRVTGIQALTGALYRRAGYLLDKFTPEQIKAGVISDYGVPEAVIDQRAMLQGRQRVQLRKAGALIEKLSTLTRAESRVAYEWMNMDGSDPKAYLSAMQGLPEESVKVLQEVQQMVDRLSREAVALGQLSQDAYERNRFAYLRRSYAKHVLEQDAGEKAKRARVISILGDQYKGRGLTEAVPMSKVQNIAPEWWKRKLQAGKADAGLKGEKFVRLERRAPAGAGTQALPGMTGRPDGRLLEVAYYPAGHTIPQQYAEWERAGTFEVRDIKGQNLVLWRDFTKEEREQMGEIDEARFAIAKTLHGMIHDVEVGRYLEWISHTYAKKEGETIPGTVVEASERFRDTFAPGEWVRVPDVKISGTTVAKYGKLAGRYIPGPIWNDLRQVVGGQFKPFGDTYAKVLTLWKTAKTALSPAVHMNNVMSNLVMADWHDVRAAHVAKALRLIMAASESPRLGRMGIADREAAREVLNRYKDSGGDIGSWATNEIAKGQLEPLLESLEKELAATGGASAQAEIGVMAALQHAVMLRFPSAWEAFKGSKPGKAGGAAAQALIDAYQAEDDVFRLAAWLQAKEQGQGDLEAGKVARKSFLDYHINAPWIHAMRQSAWPFISFTYRAVPMMLEIAGKKPHKLMKLMMMAGLLDALGYALSGGDEDKERKLLPEEKAGRIWGMVPKLIRMPWNDANGSPVFLDIRRFIPVGDVLDVSQGHSAIPILPGLQPGGPLMLAGEVVLNRSAFTGKPITLDTDNAGQKAAKLGDYLYKSFAPNVLGMPGTYATTGAIDAAKGKTDSFGREQSVAQAVASSVGIKLGSYPGDVGRLNLSRAAQAQIMEIDKNVSLLKRQYQMKAITEKEYRDGIQTEQAKKAEIARKLREKIQ